MSLRVQNITMTKERIREEILKCGRDPEYFLKTYGKVVHQKKGLLPFKTYDFQDTLLNKFREHRYNIILKSRQLGISTIVAGYIAWLMLFHRHKEVIVLATKQAKAQNILRKVKLIYDYLPEWLFCEKYKTENRTTLELTNGSRLGAETTAGDAGRSDALSLLVVDECAHVGNMEEIWTSVFPTLSTGGSCILLSSPMGCGTFFHKTYVDAENDVNEFHPTKLMWWVHPERDEEWGERERKKFSERDFAQEYECNFLASGVTVIAPEDLERLKKDTKDPRRKAGFDRGYWLWDDFDPSKKYMIVADVSRGDGADYSAFHVIELDEMNVVAEYKGKPSLDILCTFLEQVGKEWGTCMIVIENNNVGYTVAEHLRENSYPNLYYSQRGSQEFIDPVSSLGDPSAVCGFTTTVKTRPIIISKLEEYIRNKVIKIRSNRLVTELDTFIWHNGRPEAMKNYNDDLVLSLAIACWVRDTVLVRATREDTYRKQLLSNIIITKTHFDSTVADNSYELHGLKSYRQIGRKEEYDVQRRMISPFTTSPPIFIR